MTLTVDGASSLPAGPGLAVYRIVQEALTNILKHADARMATVTVKVGPRAVELEVLDDGTRPGQTDDPGHGLIGMRERVALYGGTLSAGPGERGGFAVRARLPLDTNGAVSS